MPTDDGVLEYLVQKVEETGTGLKVTMMIGGLVAVGVLKVRDNTMITRLVYDTNNCQNKLPALYPLHRLALLIYLPSGILNNHIFTSTLMHDFCSSNNTINIEDRGISLLEGISIPRTS
jgi:hypothetical protein